MLNRCGLTRFGNDLLGCRDRLLLLALGQVRGAFACFVDHLLRIGVRFRDNFLVALLGLCELLFDFLSIKLPLLDCAPAFFEHCKDGFVGEAL